MKQIIAALTLTLVALSFHAASYAQTPITDAQAQAMAQDCASKSSPYMTPQGQKLFCSCTAEQTKRNISVEDVQAIAGNDQAARNAMNKSIVTVYAPCMEFPVRDLVFTKCQKDVYQAGQNICQCLASNMGKYVSERARSDLPAILAANPNVTDPMEAIVNSPDYQQMEKRIAFGCIRGEFK